jgi:hypothetical protein
MVQFILKNLYTPVLLFTTTEPFILISGEFALIFPATDSVFAAVRLLLTVKLPPIVELVVVVMEFTLTFPENVVFVATLLGFVPTLCMKLFVAYVNDTPDEAVKNAGL